MSARSMASFSWGDGRCSGVSTNDYQVWPSWPWATNVAGRLSEPYTNNTTIWQSQSAVP
jgi:hypothetical protein